MPLSGQMEKSKFSFISCNSSFTECANKYSPKPSFTFNADCPYPPDIGCAFDISRIELSSTAQFISYLFNSLSYYRDRGVISFTGRETLLVSKCIFAHCISTTGWSDIEGEGPIFSNSGTLQSIRSSVFV